MAAAKEYNASVDSFNAAAESYNAIANEHNAGEQEKLDAYNAAMEDYSKKAATYNNYQGKIDAVSARNLATGETQKNDMGKVIRADKESILELGNVLTEDYTVTYGYGSRARTVALGHEGDLVVSWDALTPSEDHRTIQVRKGEESDSTYKVANLHIFEDFKDIYESSDYLSENGWDCMNINVDDANGIIIIPKALIDRIAMIEIDVAEVGANDTVTVTGQNSVFQSNYAVTFASRFFEGYTDGPYWMTTSTVFESNAATTESDWTGTGHTFTFADGTCDYASIKNPLNVNHYIFQRYTNPYEKPDQPEEVSTSMMGLADLISRVEVFGSKLSSLLGLPEREIKKNDPTPVPYVPVVPVIADEIPDEPATSADSDEGDEESATVPVPVSAEPENTDEEVNTPTPYAPVLPVVADEIADKPVPLAAPADDEDTSPVPVSVSTAAEKKDGELSTLVHHVTDEEISDAAVPMASGASWALLNLICSVLTILLALVSLLRRRETEEGEKETYFSLSLLVPAAASVIFFILTEDLRNPMALTDVWTPLMLVLLAANCALHFVTARRDKKAEAEA